MYLERRDRIEAVLKTSEIYERLKIDYLPEEHQTWGTLYNCLEPLWQQKAHSSYLKHLKKLNTSGLICNEAVPDTSALSDYLEEQCNLKLCLVGGLLEPSVFLDCLANRVFSTTAFMRPPHLLFLSPEPDLFHDIMGHIPMFLNSQFTETCVKIGQAGIHCGADEAAKVARLFWWLAEFGVVKEEGEIKIVGGALLSSKSEMDSIVSGTAESFPFSIDAITEQESQNLETSDVQNTLYVAESLDDLCGEISEFIDRTYGPKKVYLSTKV